MRRRRGSVVTWIIWVETFKRQTRLLMAVSLQVKSCGRRLGLRSLYVRPVCDTKAPLQLLVALYKCYMPCLCHIFYLLT